MKQQKITQKNFQTFHNYNKSKSYLGSETKKAEQNFNISGQKVEILLFRALAYVKASTSLANQKAKVIPKNISQGIVKACHEVIIGQHDSAWVTDAVQGGAGTSMNMNINELLAIRTSELLNLPDGSVHPLDHVNASQSTNDVIPTATRLMLIWLLDDYLNEIKKAKTMFEQKAKSVGKFKKVGRTHLQDAVPVAWSQLLLGYAQLLGRDHKRLQLVRHDLLTTNLGATAVGSSAGANEVYVKSVHGFFKKMTGLEFKPAKNLIDATQNIDVFVHVSQLLELSALSLSKVMNDWRLMNSGPRSGLGEVQVPTYQKGSSLMAGKVNPVHLEAYNQISYLVSGNAQVARLVLINGQFELNVMFPAFIKTTAESLRILSNGLRSLTPALAKTKINVSRCEQMLNTSLCDVTEWNQKIGYDLTGELVKQALVESKTLAQVALEKGLI
jgi:aspartate ammonia-lyase